FEWLKVLKNSPRNCARQRSVIGMFLKTPMSQLNNPGPTIAPLPTLPKPPVAGKVKAAGFNQLTHGALWQALLPRGSPPTYTPRSELRAVCETSFPAKTVKGSPVSLVTIPVSSQFPRTAVTNLLLVRGLGISHRY